jgi:predicted MPP superfamily phosphohydrolase
VKKWISLLIFVISVFLIIGQGCNGEEPQTSKNKGFEPFSFAIITDIHVGRNFSDYGAEGWADYNLATGQAINGDEGDFNNYVTDRLVATVDWLNANYKSRNIKFLVILGDIADSAEMSEFFRAKKILDNLEIPYIPLVGNHDIWSNVKDPNCWDIQSTDGELYFERIFWRDIHNKNNIDRINNLFGNSWQRQRALTDSFHLLQNYAFNYQGINFVALDYARRDLNCEAILAEPFPETKEWLKDNLENHRGEVVLVFSHYPFMVRGGFEPWEASYLARLASDNSAFVLSFGGHIHYNENINETFGRDSAAPVIVTKGLMGGKGKLQEKEDADFLRIVKVKGPNIEDVDYSEIITISTENKQTPVPPATTIVSCPSAGRLKFIQGQEVITTDDLRVRSEPILNSQIIKTEPRNTSGKILEGPVCADNYVWWKVKYQDGTIGWSAQDWLEVKIIETVTPIVLTPTPALETPIPSPTITVTPSLITEIKGKIAFVTDRDGNQEIYLMSGNSANQINLTNHPANDWDPAWSPDGSKIAFVSDRDGDAEIYIMNANGSNLVKLTNNDSGDINPAWFPDGSAIIFARHGPQEGLYPPLDRLYIMNADGTNQREFPIDPDIVQGDYALRNYNTNEPAVSPDGSKIVFTVESWWSGHFPVLYLMNSDGTNVIRFGDSIPNCSGSAN